MGDDKTNEVAEQLRRAVKYAPVGTALKDAAGLVLWSNLGLGVIAEGVETEGQLGRLRGTRCDLAQRFYFPEPLLDEAAKEWLVPRSVL